GAEKNEETEAGTTGVLSLSDIIYRSEANSEVHMICRDPKEKNIVIVMRKWRLIFTPPCQMMDLEGAIVMKGRYVGHCNVGTDIKQASFLGQRGKQKGRLMKVLVGDEAGF
ncbi:hypothetical protein HID58_050464, partial [Brassica napus]